MPTDQVKRCPSCDSGDANVTHDDSNGTWIECGECFARGPRFVDADQVIAVKAAIAAWNDMPRRARKPLKSM